MMRNLSLAALGMALVTVSGVAEARWLSVDPVKANPNNGQSFNRYKYANNNPYRYTDPDGRAESTWFLPTDGLYQSNVSFYASGAFTIASHSNVDAIYQNYDRGTHQGTQLAGGDAISKEGLNNSPHGRQ